MLRPGAPRRAQEHIDARPSRSQRQGLLVVQVRTAGRVRGQLFQHQQARRLIEQGNLIQRQRRVCGPVVQAVLTNDKSRQVANAVQHITVADVTHQWGIGRFAANPKNAGGQGLIGVEPALQVLQIGQRRRVHRLRVNDQHPELAAVPTRAVVPDWVGCFVQQQVPVHRRWWARTALSLQSPLPGQGRQTRADLQVQHATNDRPESAGNRFGNQLLHQGLSDALPLCGIALPSGPRLGR